MTGAGYLLDDWCKVLCEHFFHPKYCGREVSVCVDSELLSELAKRHQLDDLIECIEDESRCLTVRRRNPIDLAEHLLEDWLRGRRRGYPPYFPILAFLVSAAAHEGSDLADHAYWARVQRLRAERVPDAQPLNPDKRIVEMMFRDLALWANIEHQGRLGRFNFRRFGRLRYVGLIRGQSLLSASDIRALHRAFSERELSPAQSPSRWELLQAARSARTQLRPSLTRLLEGWPDDPLSEAAVDRLEDIIEAWDGTIRSEENVVTGRTTVLPMVLELRPTGHNGLRSLLRVASGTYDLPDELLLKHVDDRTVLARFDAGDLSQPLEDLNDERMIDARTVSWTEGLRLMAMNCPSVTAVRLPGRTIRFFALQGRAWVEVSMLPSHGACLIACNGQRLSGIVRWLEQLGDRQPYKRIDGAPVPPGWSLLRLERRPPDAPRTDFPIPGLTASESPAIRLHGGVRIGSSTYAPYALPEVSLGAATLLSLRLADVFDREGKKLDGVHLHRIWDSDDSFELAADERVWDVLAGFRLEAVDAQDEVQVSKTIHVSTDAPADERASHRDRWGRTDPKGEPWVWGLTFSGTTKYTIPPTTLGRVPPSDTLTSGDRFVRLLSTRSSMDWRTASRTARAIAETEDRAGEWTISRSISLQFEAMRTLGHLEIEEDAAGRFGRVCRLPACLHLLPTRAPVPGRLPYQAVLSGTYSARLREQVLKVAERMGMTTHIRRQPDGNWLVPDRISVFGDSVERLADLASDVGCVFVGKPFAASMAAWLEPPTRFLETAPWRPGPAPHASTRLAFCPYELRLRPESEVQGSLLLFECREAYADKLWSFWLYDRAGERHCACPRQLGRWIVFLGRSTPPRAIPTSATGEVYLPLELRPPQLVERAMCACSGLTPALVTFPANMVQITQLGYPRSPSEPSEWFRPSSQVYSGHWLRYERVRSSPLVTRADDRMFLACLGSSLEQIPIVPSRDVRHNHG